MLDQKMPGLDGLADAEADEGSDAGGVRADGDRIWIDRAGGRRDATGCDRFPAQADDARDAARRRGGRLGQPSSALQEGGGVRRHGQTGNSDPYPERISNHVGGRIDAGPFEQRTSISRQTLRGWVGGRRHGCDRSRGGQSYSASHGPRAYSPGRFLSPAGRATAVGVSVERGKAAGQPAPHGA